MAREKYGLDGNPASIVQLATELEEAALCDEDYPTDFVSHRHPDDYKTTSAPIDPQFIFHHIHGRHNRLWLRISWQLGPSKFMPMSFLIDTGAPKHFYLSPDAIIALDSYKVLHVDDDMDVQYVKLQKRNCPIEGTPAAHKPANIMGLKLLKRLGLKLFESSPHFAFSQPLPYLGAE